MNKKVVILLLISILGIQSLSIFARSNFYINNDFAVFYSGAENYNVEIYYSYPDSVYTLRYNDTEKQYSGNIEFILNVDSINSAGQIKSVLLEKWQAPFIRKQDVNSIYSPQIFYGIHKVSLKAGTYKATLSVNDLNDSSKRYESKFDLAINPINHKNLGLSSLQIANNIIYKNNISGDSSEYKLHNIFYKNQYYVYPNPLKEISATPPTLYLYSEIYSAKTASPDGVEIKYVIKNAKNNIEFEHVKKKPAVADAIVETISIPIDALPVGVYFVESTVYSKDKSDSITQRTKFYLINSSVSSSDNIYYTDDEMFDLSEFSTYSSERIEFEFEQYKSIASQDEINTWEKLSDIKAKQRFLYRFWFNRNPDINNPYNTKLAEFRERLKYVTTYFSYAGDNNGWKTDRGKIYLKFGEPDYKDQYPATPTQKAYEIWSYHSVEGGAQFCFIDILGLENYRLVHSTAKGYVVNYNWKNIISKNNDSKN